MNDDERAKLSDLYPKPKTYIELRQERQKIRELRRPKLVALKVAGYVSTVIAGTLVAVNIIIGLISQDLSSAGTALAAVCASVIISMILLAVVGYAYVTVKNLARIVMDSTELFTTSIYVILVGALIASLYVDKNI